MVSDDAVTTATQTLAPVEFANGPIRIPAADNP